MNCVNHADRERVAFCQNCGKALCAECSRSVGAAVFCEPCLEARLYGAGLGSAAGTAAGFTPVTPPVPPPVSAAAAGGGYHYVDPRTGIPVTRVFATHEANPWLAFGLGFIPGVGAMYNEQYAKGVVHLAVFAVLVSLADSHDIFGLFVAGWLFYMGIEAYHTATARRDGLPLPNPFGLNDIGERLGFSRGSWGMHGAGAARVVTPPAPPFATPVAGATTPQPVAPAGVPPVVPQAAAPPSSWTYVAPDYFAHYSSTGAAVPPPATGSGASGPIPGQLDMGVPHPGSRFGGRFPAGAIWLIGLGVLVLFGNMGVFHGLLWFSGRTFIPLLLIGFGIWLFFQRMTAGGRSLIDDGLGDYGYRIVRAAMGAVWIALTGVLMLLNDFGIVSWGHSWPLWLIVFGVLMILRRTAYPTTALPIYPYGPPPVATGVPFTPVAPVYTPGPSATAEGIVATEAVATEAYSVPVVYPESHPVEETQIDRHTNSAHSDQEGR